MERLKPDATGIYVAAHQAPGAIEEAIEAEVPLIVAVAEHIPIHDILRVLLVLMLWFNAMLTVQDTFNSQNTVEISTCRGECSWNYICDREVSNWLSTSSVFYARSCWHRCQVWHSKLRR
jgi:hypothetical protein